MILTEITQESQLQELAQLSNNQYVLIFKHSPYCQTSAIKNNEINNFNFSVPISGYRINVIDSKPISQKIAQIWNVLHMSPQVIILKDNKVIEHCSHYNINFPNLNLRLITK